jgi:hypothetical protein
MDHVIEEKEVVWHRGYDTGWNDRLDGKPLPTHCTRSYRTGWLDCDELSDEQRQVVKKR